MKIKRTDSPGQYGHGSLALQRPNEDWALAGTAEMVRHLLPSVKPSGSTGEARWPPETPTYLGPTFSPSTVGAGYPGVSHTEARPCSGGYVLCAYNVSAPPRPPMCLLDRGQDSGPASMHIQRCTNLGLKLT
ncbi:hypothetical protein NDU88_001468 [Pleurodeles waltl]|uniref:Uncharacterized protein n=1 Tax=Pleurodeles waltl TaxID=8319 RepID=A0AAV7M0J9_PLEWA|nr:hypothetical protein NDU88_001468 [Pleurodeles waltl]